MASDPQDHQGNQLKQNHAAKQLDGEPWVAHSRALGTACHGAQMMSCPSQKPRSENEFSRASPFTLITTHQQDKPHRNGVTLNHTSEINESLRE